MAMRRRTKLLVVHVTATRANGKLTSEKLRKMHKNRGFRDIGYNEWIDRKGKLFRGRGVDEIGAHVRGYNSIAYGIAMEGGWKKNDITLPQMVTLEKRLRELVKKYHDAKICGHRDLSPDADGDGIVEPHEHVKACPRFDAIPWAESKGLPGADIRGVWSEVGKAGPDARIVWLQKLLRNKGYQVGPTDGHHGIKTTEAIIQFQTDFNLPVNGEFDVVTVKKLRELNEAPVTEIAEPQRKRPTEKPAETKTSPAKPVGFWGRLIAAVMKILKRD